VYNLGGEGTSKDVHMSKSVTKTRFHIQQGEISMKAVLEGETGQCDFRGGGVVFFTDVL